MLTTSGPSAEVPTTALIASLAVWHWIAVTPAGQVAFLLLTQPAHAPGSSLTKVAPHMRGLAASLGLVSCTDTLPDIGPRLFIEGMGAFLRLDGCEYLLHVPVAGPWNEFAAAGGTVAVAVGLDPLPAHSPKELVEAYLTASARAGRLFLGKTAAPTRPDQPVAAGGVEEL